MVSGTHAPGSPPICADVHASIAGRSSRYMFSSGVLSAALPELRLAETWPRRFQNQYPDGYQSWWSRLKLNRSATPAWLPANAPRIDAASVYRYSVLMFSRYWAAPSTEV